MENKIKSLMTLCLLVTITSIMFALPINAADPATTYGPHVDELIGRFIESVAAQQPMLYGTDAVDFWPDIRDPDTLRLLQDDGFTVVSTPEAYLFYHIDFNVRSQYGNGTHVQLTSGWAALKRGPLPRNNASYNIYRGAEYQGYAPFADVEFRKAIALMIPKAEIVATAYGGISGAAIDSFVPEAQKKWYNSDMSETIFAKDSFSMAEANQTLWDAGYEWVPGAPRIDDTYGPGFQGEAGNWRDPLTGDYMNWMTFAGVTESIASDSYGRDDLCWQKWRDMGVPISHPEVDYGELTEDMMDYFQYDMYALGWSIGGNPDHLYSFFHSDNDRIPEGYNIPGVHDTALDALIDVIQFNTDITPGGAVWTATQAAQLKLAEVCVSIPTVTRPLFIASVKVGDKASSPDTLEGIVNVPGDGADTAWTFTNWRWASDADGIGGSARYIVPSENTNWHPGYASTTDEWLVMTNIVEGLLEADPYTGYDLPWLALDWDVDESYNDPITETGMNLTFWLRDDVYFHDGEKYNATQAKFSLELGRDNEISRLFSAWGYMTDVQTYADPYIFSVLMNETSPWMLYDVAGAAALFPKGCYEGTDRFFRPETTVNPYNSNLTCLIGTAPYVMRDFDLALGGYVRMTAFRPEADDNYLSDHYWKSIADWDSDLATMFHWVGDVDSDSDVDVYDLSAAGQSYGLHLGDIGYNGNADINPEPTYHTNDGFVDIFDIAELSKSWGKQRDYP